MLQIEYEGMPAEYNSLAKYCCVAASNPAYVVKPMDMLGNQEHNHNIIQLSVEGGWSWEYYLESTPWLFSYQR